MRRGLGPLLAAVAAATWTALGAPVARAQARADTSELQPLNFAFSAIVGTGVYAVEGHSAFIFRIPVGFTVRSLKEKPWGLSIQVPITLGFYDFDPRELLPPDLRLPDQVGTVSVVPGVEFRFPVTSSWRLMPFASFGPAKDFESGEVAYVGSLGTWSRAEFPLETRRLVLWNRLLWAKNVRNDSAFDDDFAMLETQFEVRQPIGARTAVSFLVRNEFFFNEIAVVTDEETFTVRDRWEVGGLWGPKEEGQRLWKIPLPRIGLTYIFGAGGNGVRLVIDARY